MACRLQECFFKHALIQYVSFCLPGAYRARACLKKHSRNLPAPFAEIFFNTKKERPHRRSIILFFRAPHLGMVSQTLPLQLTQPRHPHGTQEILLSAATFLS